MTCCKCPSKKIAEVGPSLSLNLVTGKEKVTKLNVGILLLS